jgi:hypothetical protein
LTTLGCCCARCPVPSRPPGGTGSAVPAAPQPFRPARPGPSPGSGRSPPGAAVTVLAGDDTFRLVIDGETVAVAARAVSSEIHRYKAYAIHRGRR